MKVAWKYIKGYGPYAYLQSSERDGDSVTSKHVRYLGRAGGNLLPGATINVDGHTITVPDYPGDKGIVEPKTARQPAQQYVIKDDDGNLTYVGHTNDLDRRAAEHTRSGVLSADDTIESETGLVTRQAAERSETQRVAAHRSRHGENPADNAVSPQAPGTNRVSGA